jgi:hypothetical protein
MFFNRLVEARSESTTPKLREHLHDRHVSGVRWLAFFGFIAELRKASEIVTDENLVTAHDLYFIRGAYHVASL